MGLLEEIPILVLIPENFPDPHLNVILTEKVILTYAYLIFIAVRTSHLK
jgi:hypothetical protein